MRVINGQSPSYTLRTLALGGAATALVLAFGSAAWAQDTGSDPESQASTTLEEVVVTGTSIRGIRPVGSATVPLTREEIQSTGLQTTADVVRTLPQLQNIGIDETRTAGAQDAGTNSGRGTALNLRGLGANATLMLVDGRRIAPSGTVSAFGDPNQIPIAALERIEVVTDGASAIYGTDAVGGVVNFIIRKNFDGAELTGRYSTTDGYSQSGFSAVLGRSWSNGNFVVSYDYEDREAMLRSASPYMLQDLRQFGGNDNRISGTTVTARVPVIVTQGGGVIRYFSVPDNRTNAPLTAGQLITGADVVDSAEFTDYLPQRERHSLTLFANLDLTDDLTLYYQGFYNSRDTISQSYRVDTLTLPASNPYYISGLPGVAPGQALSVRYPWFKDFGRRWLIATERSYSQTAGATLDLPNDWRMDAYVTYAQAENCQCEQGPSAGIVNTTALNQLLAANDPSFNPFSPDPIADSVRARVLGENRQRNATFLTDVVLKFDGPIYSLSSGDIRGAIGGEFMEVTGEYRNAGTTTRPDNAYIPTYTGDKTRRVTSLFGELFVPLIGEGSNLPFARRLDLSLAARYENYSDFGETTNPKIGLTWEPTDDLLVRGTWGQSFRAPSLQENNEDVVTTFIVTNVSNGAGDPTIPITNTVTGTSTVLSRIGGGNNNLQPERAETFSLGFDYTPDWFDGFRLSATYYNINYEGKILTLGGQASTFLANPTNRAAYAPYIVAAPQPSTCVEGDPSTYNPVYIPFVTASYPIPFTGVPFCSMVAYLNGQAQNLGVVEQDGIDVNVGYEMFTDAGTVSFGVSLTEILNLRQTVSPVSGLLDVLDVLNNPVSTRWRGNVSYRSNGGFSANVFANYVGGYLNNAPITVNGVRQAESQVDAWLTFDANFSYVSPDEWPAWAQGLRFSLSIQNFTDEDPPLVLTGTNAFDSQQANPYGRIWSFEISRRW